MGITEMGEPLVKRFIAFIFVLGLVLGVNTARAATLDEAKAMAIEAAALLAKDGKEKAYPVFHDPAGGFLKGELYVFVVNYDGIWEMYGPKAAVDGQNVLNLKDVDGKEFVKEMIEVGKTKGEGWVEYQWKHPETGKTQAKASYVKAVGNAIVGVGVYK